MVLPGEKCRVPPQLEWTESEKWAWQEICEGRVANFNLRRTLQLGEFEILDPRKPADDHKWSDDRKLNSDFLETILLHEPFRSAIPRQGIRIIGAYFPDPIDLNSARIERPLELKSSRFLSKVDTSYLTTPTWISLDGSKFVDNLDTHSTSIGYFLFMRQAEFGKVNLTGVKIGGQIDMSEATFTGKLVMESISVTQSLFMRRARFGEIILRGAKIGNQFDMSGAIFMGKLDLDSVSVAQALFMREAKFGEIDLRGAKIGNQLDMSDSTFTGKLVINSASIGVSLFIQQAILDNQADLRFLNVGSGLDARGATLRDLDLTGAQIGNFLRIGSFKWKNDKNENENPHDPKLTLRNTSVGVLQDTKDTWPDHLELDGFKYERLGEMGINEHEKPHKRGSSWFINWLEKDKSYSPQPYLHLAGVLRGTGHEDIADKVLFAGKNRERNEACGNENAESKHEGSKKWSVGKCVWLTVLQVVIGYGIGLYMLLSLLWVVFFVFIGWNIMYWSGQHEVNKRSIGGLIGLFWFSFDHLLPILRLRDAHFEKVDMKPWVRGYFHFHQIIGYALVFFVIAGLSGLTE